MQESSVPPCPYLPTVTCALPITHTRKHREECGVDFYLACLELAQSLWLQQLPAQAMLQLNKSMMAVLPADHQILKSHPIPYAAMHWIIRYAASKKFIGNPPRHFQHLATRMNHKLPQPELRVARAWCCFHLAESILPSKEFPRDEKQIKEESLVIITPEEALQTLEEQSPHSDEVGEIKRLL